MNRIKGNVNLEKTVAFTKSSFAYKDPFKPSGGLFYKMRNKVHTFFSSRNIENEFIDYKVSEFLYEQVPELYEEASDSFKRKEKVTLERVCTEPMYKHLLTLEKDDNPFLTDGIWKSKMAQARIYVGGDSYIAEEQWAQITISLNRNEQYAIFERRLSDRNTFRDWKLFLLMSREDFEFLHKPYNKFESTTGSAENEIDFTDNKNYEEHVRAKRRVRKELYV
ncbi:unnamed protein product [Moneuplotes crassus]|uniref:Uncharacterized protein n=1 Tax=Euplotes crassus TaxID=5936 RepID=A0AAD1XRY9_EUPCR|nr:unnamed protein product [Moneuplotes crassus]